LADPLLYARAVHFAATMLVAGVVLFVVFVAAPAWRGGGGSAVAVNVRRRLAVIAWIGLAVVTFVALRMIWQGSFQVAGALGS